MADDDDGPWQLIDVDTFANEAYPVSNHATEQACREAARDYLRRLEREQPSEESGGQDGIQDQVFIVGPGGVRYRYERVPDA